MPLTYSNDDYSGPFESQYEEHEALAGNRGNDAYRLAASAIHNRGLAAKQSSGPKPSTSSPSQQQSGYRSFGDAFDGGGERMAGARFARGNVSMFDKNGDGYISEAEFQNAEKEFPEIYKNQVMGGIPALSNFSGARPRGSYAQERNLGPQGTNIGTSGLANYVAGAGALGGVLRGGRPNRMMMANPNMPRGAMFTPENVKQYTANPVYGQSPLRNLPLGLGPGIDMLASGAAFSDDPQKRFNSLLQRGYTPEQAAEYLRKTDQNLGKPPTDYSQYGTQPTKPLSPIPVGMNMGGLMALRDYNMGMQMGMGKSV